MSLQHVFSPLCTTHVQNLKSLLSKPRDYLSPASLERAGHAEGFIFCSDRESRQSKNILQPKIRQMLLPVGHTPRKRWRCGLSRPAKQSYSAISAASAREKSVSCCMIWMRPGRTLVY
jgi:hypothetical protein